MPDKQSNKQRGGFVLSLDFELMWGVRDRRTIADYGPNILGVRQVVPRLLDLFARHRLGCTWATVGMLFFDDRDALLAALPEERPGYADPRLSPYGDLEILGATERDDPYHYGLSMIRQIAQVPHQEIGTHTFSHFYCLEPGQTVDDFRADLAAAFKAAQALGLALESIVFPRNQTGPEYVAACREAGLRAWRGTEAGWMYRPSSQRGETLLKRGVRLADAYLNLTGANGALPASGNGMVDVPSSRFLRPWSARLAPLEPLRLSRILAAMRAAARRGELFHLWFHPHNFGLNQEDNLAVLERIAAEARRLDEAHGWPALTMAEAARRCAAA